MADYYESYYDEYYEEYYGEYGEYDAEAIEA